MNCNEMYRLSALYELLDVLNAPKSGRHDIRLIDQTHGTRFLLNLSAGSHWPAFVDWFGLVDTVGDLFVEAEVAMVLDSPFEDLADIEAKYTATPLTNYTPTLDPELRAELDLDGHERGWIWSVRFVELRNELKRAHWTELKEHRLTFLARKHLAYALYAMRTTGHEKLAAFCFAAFFKSDLIVKLIEMRRLSHWQSDGMPRHSMPHLDRVVAYIKPDSSRPDCVSYLEWAMNGALSPDQTERLEQVFARIHQTLAATDQRQWPGRDQLNDMRQLVLDYCHVFAV